MSKFKFGETVVAKLNLMKGDEVVSKKGDEHIVDGFACCPKCGHSAINIQAFPFKANVDLNCCNGGSLHDVRPLFSEDSFEKPISLFEGISYRMKVTIPELVKIKEYQNQ